jgi:putative redox protein
MPTIREVHVTSNLPELAQTIQVGPHTLVGDGPKEIGGEDKGPEPQEILLGALGTCTAMTLILYARNKKWSLEAVDVKVSGKQDGAVYAIERSVKVKGALDDEQRARLLQIAEKCPVHKILTGEVKIHTTVAALA